MPVSFVEGQRKSLASILAEDADSSSLQNIFRFLGRPGFLFRSVLSGDWEGAGRNLLQIANEFPTGGFIDRDFTVTNLLDRLPLVPDLPTDFTTREHQPEFSDLMKRWGASAPSGTLEKLGLDLFGGILTDPLTLLAGSSALRGIGKASSLVGGRADVGRQLLVSGLKSTPQGTEGLGAATNELLGEFVRRKPGSAFAQGLAAEGREGLENLASRALAGEQAAVDRLASFGPGLSVDSNFNKVGAVLRGFEEKAAQKILGTNIRARSALDDLDTVPARFHESLGGAILGRRAARERTMEEVGEGLRALEETKWLPSPGAFYWGLPFTRPTRTVPGLGRDAWARIGKYGTAPGWITHLMSMNSTTKPAAQAVQAAASASMNWLKAHLGDKYAYGLAMPESFRHAVRQFDAESVGRNKAVDRIIRERFSLLQEGTEETLAQGIDETYDALQALQRGDDDGIPEWLREILERDARTEWDDYEAARDTLDEAIRREERDRRSFLQKDAPDSEERRSLIDRPEGHTATATQNWEVARARLLNRLDNVDGRSPLQDRILARVADDPFAEGALTEYLAGMRGIPKELTELGVYKFDTSNPFYLPRQIGVGLQTLLSESIGNTQLRNGVRDIFTTARRHNTQEDFLARIREIAEGHGVDLTGIEDLQDLSLSNLFRERMFAHHRTVARAKAYRLARKNRGVQLNKDISPAYKNYLRFQFSGPGMRENFLTKFLGGGKFSYRVDDTRNPELIRWAQGYDEDKHIFKRTFIPRSLAKDGQARIEVHWPGLNAIYKPLLTSFPTNMNFHIRNNTGAIMMHAFHPDSGWGQGFRQAWGALRHGPLVRALAGRDYKGDEISAVVRALVTEDPSERAEMLARLAKSGKTWGGRSWNEVVGLMDNFLGAKTKSADVTDLTRRIEELPNWSEILHGRGSFKDRTGSDLRAAARFAKDPSRSARKKLQISFRRMVKLGMDIADDMEVRHRATAFLALLDKGLEPTQAMKQVGDMFVDYSLNSTVERVIRDIFPFAKFVIGSTKWAKTVAERPRLVSWMGRTQGSLASDEYSFLPERVEDSWALPIPWEDKEGNVQFLTGLGLPIEVTMNIMGAPFSAQGFRRQILGGVHPVVRLPAEWATNRSFYFGDEWGKYRKAPEWLPEEFTTKITLPDGRVRYEVPGAINELVRALPSSRLDSMVEKMLDDRRAWWNTAINNLTGARIASVDVEQELRLRLQDYLKDKARSGLAGETLVYFSRVEDQEMPEDLKVVLATLGELKKEKRQAQKKAALVRPVGF